MGLVDGGCGWEKRREKLASMIYLASTSPRRKRLLRESGIRFRVLHSSYQEELHGSIPASHVKQHALGKALGASPFPKKGLVLGADTIVYFGGKIIGKPKDLKDAFQILSSLQGRWHTVYTGVALVDARTKKRVLLSEKTKVLIRKMTAPEVKRYFKKISPLDKAGAYAIQAHRSPIVECIQGSFSNAVGLPLERIVDIIKQ